MATRRTRSSKLDENIDESQPPRKRPLLRKMSEVANKSKYKNSCHLKQNVTDEKFKQMKTAQDSTCRKSAQCSEARNVNCIKKQHLVEEHTAQRKSKRRSIPSTKLQDPDFHYGTLVKQEVITPVKKKSNLISSTVITKAKPLPITHPAEVSAEEPVPNYIIVRQKKDARAFPLSNIAGPAKLVSLIKEPVKGVNDQELTNEMQQEVQTNSVLGLNAQASGATASATPQENTVPYKTQSEEADEQKHDTSDLFVGDRLQKDIKHEVTDVISDDLPVQYELNKEINLKDNPQGPHIIRTGKAFGKNNSTTVIDGTSQRNSDKNSLLEDGSESQNKEAAEIESTCTSDASKKEDKKKLTEAKSKKQNQDTENTEDFNIFVNKNLTDIDGVKHCIHCNTVVHESKALTHLTNVCKQSPYRIYRLYPCSKCCMKFTRRVNLKKHEKMHLVMSEQQQEYPCEVCGQVNCRGSDTEAEVSAPTSVCELCNEVMEDSESYTEHKKAHLENQYCYQCEFCAKKYRTKRDLNYHQRIKHLSNFQYNCANCGLGLKSRNDIKNHKCPVENPVASAKKAVYQRIEKLREKHQREEPETVVILQEPERRFIPHHKHSDNEEEEIVEILSEKASGDAGAVVMIGLKEEEQADINQIIMAATSETTLCQEGQGGEAVKSDPETSSTQTENDSPLEKKDQDEQSPAHLATQSLDIVTNFQPQTLTLKSAEQPAASSQAKARKKRKSHSGDKEYVCEFCKASFGSAGGRHKHLKIIHGYKRTKANTTPSACFFCTRMFNSVHHLKEHIRAVHTDDKQFECNICQKRYRSLKDRDYHIKTVHFKQYRYQCSECGKGMHSVARFSTHRCDWGVKTLKKLAKTTRRAPTTHLTRLPGQEPAISRKWSSTKVKGKSQGQRKGLGESSAGEVVVTGTVPQNEMEYLVAFWDEKGELIVGEPQEEVKKA